MVQAEAIPAGERFSEQAVDEALREIEREHQREMEEKQREYSREITNWKNMNDNKTKQINKLDEEKRALERVATQFIDKYEKAKAGTLLGFQEVELEEKDKEFNELQYLAEKLMDKCDYLKRELEKSEEAAQKLVEDNQKAVFLYHIVANCADEGAHIHLGKGKVIRVLSKEEADEVIKQTENETPERLSGEELMKKLSGQE